MAIARIFAPSKLEKPDLNVDDYIWDHIMENYSRWIDEDVKLLYMAQQSSDSETSLIVDIKNKNAFSEFVNKHISNLDHVEGITLFDLISPQFYPVPNGTPLDFQRYVAIISAEPKEYSNIFRRINEIGPEKDSIITYVAYIFHSVGKDMIVSIVARKVDSVKDFIDRNIKTLNGVNDVDLTLVDRTIKLVSRDEWTEYVKPYTSKKIRKGFEGVDKDQKIIPWEYNEKFVCC